MTNENIIKALLRFNNRMKKERENHEFTTLISNESIDALDEAIKALEQQPCEECISRKGASHFLCERLERFNKSELYDKFSKIIDDMYNLLPSVKPKYTDEEIQKMQELEQAQLEKAYELGMQISFEEWLSTFNTDSATECFTAVQELKEMIKEG